MASDEDYSSSRSMLNSFENDGSFMEVYKQKLKQQEEDASKKQEPPRKIESDKRKTANLLLQV